MGHRFGVEAGNRDGVGADGGITDIKKCGPLCEPASIAHFVRLEEGQCNSDC